MRITLINHACFHVESGDLHVYTDPFKIPKGLPAATHVLVSHEHYDHADEQSIKQLKGKDTAVICPATCVGKLAKFSPVGLDVGGTVEINGLKVTGFPAATFPGKKFHPRENKWLGFVFEVEGKKLYHAGDTDIMEDMASLAAEKIDVAMLPVGNKGYTMDFNDAAKATALIKPRVVVPMHDWDQDLAPFVQLVASKVPGVKVEVLKGKVLEI